MVNTTDHAPHRRLRLLGAGLAVASTLALAAGCGDSGGSSSTGNETSAPAASASTFKVTGTDSLKFEPTTGTIDAGKVTITLTAEKAVNHDVVIEGVSKEPVVAAAAGKTKSGTVELKAGTYTFYCDVPGHRSAGMEGTLTVK
jgi:plastocyanin